MALPTTVTASEQYPARSISPPMRVNPGSAATQ
jgi:hypothetical protein